MKNDVYQVVTDRIIRLLESGTVPWHQPWKGGRNHAPRNFISRKVYRGINFFLLNAARYPSPFWLTFKQVHMLGGRVKKGEQSFPVVFWKIFEEPQESEIKRVPFLRYYSVFNASQCEGLPAAPTDFVQPNNDFQPLAECERVISEMPKRPKIVHAGERACYLPVADEISMPKPDLFETAEAYYSTLFHELTHATGHVSRLSRKEINGPVHFGSEPYSREELVAEMGAAFLCGHCEIDNKTITQSAGYIQGWLERLKDDRKLVVHAATQAQKACDFILDVQQAEEDVGPTEHKPKEFKVVALRECPSPGEMQQCDDPERAANYWRQHIQTSEQFNATRECFVVLLLNTRRRVQGHEVVSVGIMDSVLVHPRDVFRTAIMKAASAIVLMHNLCVAAHKLCYVARGVMCSRKERYAAA